MPWIKTIGPDEATGRLGKTYAASIAQTGKVFGITSSMSLDPRVLDSSMGLYRNIVQEGDALSRLTECYPIEMISGLRSQTRGVTPPRQIA